LVRARHFGMMLPSHNLKWHLRQRRPAAARDRGIAADLEKVA
jgi:hypothetical protein